MDHHLTFLQPLELPCAGPSSTIAITQRLSKLTEEHDCQCLFQLANFGQGCYKPGGGCFSTPSTPPKSALELKAQLHSPLNSIPYNSSSAVLKSIMMHKILKNLIDIPTHYFVPNHLSLRNGYFAQLYPPELTLLSFH